MQNLYKIDKLNFLTAGMPLATGKGGYPKAIEILKELNLDGMEVEFVHGVRMSDETRAFLKNIQTENPLVLTAHGPFYINLNSKEEEKIEASVQRFEQVLPCIDFSHIHARNAGTYNTYDEYCKVLDRISTELGEVAINNFHAHLAGIEYTAKGEKNHLNLAWSDMNYKDLLKAMKSFGVKGALVCESPNIETDAKLLKDYYLSL